MGCGRLRQSCCGCSLQTGTKIIGILALIGTAIQFIVELMKLMKGEQSKGFTFVSLGLSAVTVISSALLVVAAYKSRRGFALPWLVIGMMQLIFAGVYLFYVIYLIVLTTSVSGHVDDQDAQYALGVLSIGLYIALGACILGIVLGSYLWVVVLSFYLELKENEKGNFQQVAYQPDNRAEHGSG